tara:strand:- start:30 stop:572 length:543 start_codon:yes stop_codon:yes gene_type:complete
MPVSINGNGTITGLATLPDSAMASGSVIQVVQNTRTDLISTTSATFTDVLSQAITLNSTSNKVLIFFQGMECTDGGDGNTYSRYKLMRDSTSIYNGTDGNTASGFSSGRFGRQGDYFTDPVQIMFMDSLSPFPSLNITYKVQFNSLREGTFRVSLGGTVRDQYSSDTRVPTNLILMEVAA